MNLQIDAAELRRLMEQTVIATLETVRADHAKLNGRLGYTEPEAAALIGVARHTLRDCRLRGEITARMVGRKYIYSRDSLLRFLNGSKR